MTRFFFFFLFLPPKFDLLSHDARALLVPSARSFKNSSRKIGSGVIRCRQSMPFFLFYRRVNNPTRSEMSRWL